MAAERPKRNTARPRNQGGGVRDGRRDAPRRQSAKALAAKLPAAYFGGLAFLGHGAVD